MKFSIEKINVVPNTEMAELAHTKLVERVLKTIKRRETFIGDGSTSEVFTFKDNPNICVKVVDEAVLAAKNMPFGDSNPLDMEMDFLNKACVLNKSVVRIPRPYFHAHVIDGERKSHKNIHMLAMSRVRGVSLREIYRGDYGVPLSFDQKNFFGKVEECLKVLNEGGVFHNDIDPGNLMVDLQDSTPGIIDFGEAKEFNNPGANKVPEGEIYDIHAIRAIDEEFLDNV